MNLKVLDSITIGGYPVLVLEYNKNSEKETFSVIPIAEGSFIIKEGVAKERTGYLGLEEFKFQPLDVIKANCKYAIYYKILKQSIPFIINNNELERYLQSDELKELDKDIAEVIENIDSEITDYVIEILRHA